MTWMCNECTFANSHDEFLACEICGTPRFNSSHSNGSQFQRPSSSSGTASSIPVAVPIGLGTSSDQNKSTGLFISTLNHIGYPPHELSGQAIQESTKTHKEILHRTNDISPSAPSLWQMSSDAILQPTLLKPGHSPADVAVATPQRHTKMTHRTESAERGDMIDNLFGENDDQRKLFDELRETEQTFVQSLQVAVNQFYRPLLAACNSYTQILSLFEVKAIFSNLEDILALNQKLLSTIDVELGKIRGPRLGDALAAAFLHAFKLVLPDFEQYSVYINNYKSAIDVLKSCSECKPAFVKFLQDTSAKPECRNLDLGAYLIMPVQRLCKYPLFFASLLKRTNSDHISFSTIKEAAAKVNDITERVNLRKGVAEKSIRGLQIANQLEGVSIKKYGERLMSSGRTFMDEWHGYFSKDSFRRKLGLDREKKPRHFFLFNNLLVVAKRTSETKYDVRAWIPLHSLLLKDPSSFQRETATAGPSINSSKSHSFPIQMIHAVSTSQPAPAARNSLKARRGSRSSSFGSNETYTMWFKTPLERESVWKVLSNAVQECVQYEATNGISRAQSLFQPRSSQCSDTTTRERPKSDSFGPVDRVHIPIASAILSSNHERRNSGSGELTNGAMTRRGSLDLLENSHTRARRLSRTFGAPPLPIQNEAKAMIVPQQSKAPPPPPRPSPATVNNVIRQTIPANDTLKVSHPQRDGKQQTSGNFNQVRQIAQQQQGRLFTETPAQSRKGQVVTAYTTQQQQKQLTTQVSVGGQQMETKSRETNQFNTKTFQHQENLKRSPVVAQGIEHTFSTGTRPPHSNNSTSSIRHHHNQFYNQTGITQIDNQAGLQRNHDGIQQINNQPLLQPNHAGIEQIDHENANPFPEYEAGHHHTASGIHQYATVQESDRSLHGNDCTDDALVNKWFG